MGLRARLERQAAYETFRRDGRLRQLLMKMIYGRDMGRRGKGGEQVVGGEVRISLARSGGPVPVRRRELRLGQP